MSARQTRLVKPDDSVTQLARELEGVVLETLLEKLTNDDLRANEFEEFFRGLLKESDSVQAIVASAYIDERLKELFSKALNPHITGGLTSLFNALGPLSTSSARIQIAGSLFWLDARTYSNLHCIRKIRNEFAHRPYSRTFKERRISSIVASMAPLEQVDFEKMPELFAKRPSPTIGQQFYLRTMLTCQRMIGEMATAPFAVRMGLSPLSAVRVEWKRLPKAINELAMSAARLVLECLSPVPDPKEAKEKANPETD